MSDNKYFGGSVLNGKIPPSLSSPLKVESNPLAKDRFEVCKLCPESPDGFSCRMSPGCCFGKNRTDPSFHCPKGEW